MVSRLICFFHFCKNSKILPLWNPYHSSCHVYFSIDIVCQTSRLLSISWNTLHVPTMLYRSLEEWFTTKNSTLNLDNCEMSIWVVGEKGVKMVSGGIINSVFSRPTRKYRVLDIGQFPNHRHWSPHFIKLTRYEYLRTKITMGIEALLSSFPNWSDSSHSSMIHYGAKLLFSLQVEPNRSWHLWY